MVKFLETHQFLYAEEAVIERGEIDGLVYFAKRTTKEDRRISIEIDAGKERAVYALLHLQENCLVIEEIDFHHRLLKSGFARRIIWLILSEAVEKELAVIEGYVSNERKLPCLFNAFHRYGFGRTSEDSRQRFYINLGLALLPVLSKK